MNIPFPEGAVLYPDTTIVPMNIRFLLGLDSMCKSGLALDLTRHNVRRDPRWSLLLLYKRSHAFVLQNDRGRSSPFGGRLSRCRSNTNSSPTRPRGNCGTFFIWRDLKLPLRSYAPYFIRYVIGVRCARCYMAPSFTFACRFRNPNSRSTGR